MHLIDKKYLRVLFSLVSILFLLNFQFEIINNLNSNKEPLKEKLSTDIESNEVILDEINSFCDGVKYQDYGYLKIEDINYIDIEILDRDNWFKNLFYLSIEKQRAINPKYKDEFKAKIKVYPSANIAIPNKIFFFRYVIPIIYAVRSNKKISNIKKEWILFIFQIPAFFIVI